MFLRKNFHRVKLNKIQNVIGFYSEENSMLPATINKLVYTESRKEIKERFNSIFKY